MMHDRAAVDKCSPWRRIAAFGGAVTLTAPRLRRRPSRPCRLFRARAQIGVGDQRVAHEIFPVSEHGKALTAEFVLDARRRRRRGRTLADEHFAPLLLAPELIGRLVAREPHRLSGGNEVVRLEVVGKYHGRRSGWVDVQQRQIAVGIGLGIEDDEIAGRGLRLVEPHLECDPALKPRAVRPAALAARQAGRRPSGRRARAPASRGRVARGAAAGQGWHSCRSSFRAPPPAPPVRVRVPPQCLHIRRPRGTGGRARR